jgi:diaminopropionate ammonia-lyase
MQLLVQGEPAIEAGESAVAGLGAAIVAREDADMSVKLGLDESSRIFVIGTEGATDPELYHQLLSQ